MEPHIEISELIRLRDGAHPPTRARELRAHLRNCALCRDEFDQLAMNDALAADLRALRKANFTPIPAQIDQRVWARLVESITSGTGGPRKSSSRPNRKRPHPEAPRIPDYTLLQRIGQGAFGEVWEAQDRTGLACAVKVLLHEARDYEIRGITQARNFTHPSLVAIRHVGLYRRRLYYVMECVPDSLAARLAGGHPLPVEEALKISRSLLESLAACHSAGLAHRDIKPENIGFAADGTLKLLDLGLVTGADRTDATRVGTPLYMPPVPGANPAQDDLYAAGKVLYFMLTGEKPPAEILPLTAAKRGAGELACLLHQAARKAAAPNPSRRFSSAGEFIAAIISDLPRKKSPSAACSPVNSNSETKPQKQIMNSTQQLLTEAATVVGSIGLTQRQQALLQEAEKLSRPKYKVAVIGQFKSGKSTLINRVFLKDNLLFTDLMEATAVPTEVEQGAEKRLEVYPRLFRKGSDPIGENDTIQFGSGEGNPIVTTNPTTEDIKSVITAADAAGRAALARQTARVRLTWPAPALKGYTVVDTPGINTINQAVAETTYRVIPEADVAIFVTPARQLDTVDLDFLRSRVFGEGLSRCLLTVNHDTRKHPLGQGQLDDVVKDIAEDLVAIGRATIPITTVNLGEPTGSTETVAAYERCVHEFLVNNVLPGRIERAKNILRRQLQQARLECEAELTALQKTPAEKQAILLSLRKDARDTEQRYNALTDELIGELKEIHDAHLSRLSFGLDKIRENFLMSLRGCDDLTAMQKHLEQAPSRLKAPVEELLFNAANETRNRVRELEAKYGTSFRDATAPWRETVARELRMEDGRITEILKSTPYPVLFLVDVVTTTWLMPGGPILGTIWRVLFSILPVIRDLLPANLFKKALVAWVEREVTKQFEGLKTSLRADSGSVFQAVENRVRDAWQQHLESETMPVTGAMETAVDAPKNPARAEALRTAGLRIDQIQAQLS